MVRCCFNIMTEPLALVFNYYILLYWKQAFFFFPFFHKMPQGICLIKAICSQTLLQRWQRLKMINLWCNRDIFSGKIVVLREMFLGFYAFLDWSYKCFHWRLPILWTFWHSKDLCFACVLQTTCLWAFIWKSHVADYQNKWNEP